MQCRKEAMARARKRRRKDININASDDFIMNLIGGMKMVAREDKQLNPPMPFVPMVTSPSTSYPCYSARETMGSIRVLPYEITIKVQ